MKDPFTVLYQKGKAVYETRDYAKRQALGHLWLTIVFFIFMFQAVGVILMVILVEDTLTLAKYYSQSVMNLWIVDYLQSAIYFLANFLIINIILFLFTAPRLIRLGVKVLRIYGDKERGFYQLLDHKIKKRFPKYKTVEERIRHRQEHPRKLTKFELRVKKFLDSQSPISRRLITWMLSISLFIGLLTFTILISGEEDDVKKLVKDFIFGKEDSNTPRPEKSNNELLSQYENRTWADEHKSDKPMTIFDSFTKR